MTYKDQLRKDFLQRRYAMSDSEVLHNSDKIAKRLIKNVDWLRIKTAHVYLPIKKLKEVDTSFLVEYITNNQPHIRLTLGSMLPSPPIPKDKFDLIIVPTLAFDAQNNRLGWGGGWYDKFLAGQSQALKIGLSYQAGFASNGLPHKAHDIKLDKVITEV